METSYLGADQGAFDGKHFAGTAFKAIGSGLIAAIFELLKEYETAPPLPPIPKMNPE
jgi:hypothetical protein